MISTFCLPGTVLRSSGECPCTSALGLFTRRYSAGSAKLSPPSNATVSVRLSLDRRNSVGQRGSVTTFNPSKAALYHIEWLTKALRNRGERGRDICAGNHGLRTRRDDQTCPVDRSVPEGHQLPARLRDGPLRFPLRVLHVGVYVVPAKAGPADARGTRPAVQRVHRP